MAVQRLIRHSVLRLGLQVSMAAFVAAGCQGRLPAEGSLAATAPATGAATGGGDTHTTAAVPSSPTRARRDRSAPQACRAVSLALRLGPGAGGAAGSRHPALQFTNVGTTTCVMAGFPEVSYVAGDGRQVGASATGTGPLGGKVTLAPGQLASALVQEANTQNFPPGDCKPMPVRGFRVSPPSDATALFVPFGSAEATACSSTTMPGGRQLFVHSMMPGSGE